MNASKYDQQLALACPTCGGKEFEFDAATFAAGDSSARCTTCDRQLTKDELVAENGEVIEEQVKEIGREIVSDFKSDLKRALKGNKFIKIK